MIRVAAVAARYRDPLVRTGLFVGGLALAALSISSGFIWAYEQRLALVFVCSAAAWSGYLAAHYAVTGTIVDGPSGGTGTAPWRARAGTLAPESGWRYGGIAVGFAVLVSGMYVGTSAVRAHDHVVSAFGAVLFLLGYVVAHYAATGNAL